MKNIRVFITVFVIWLIASPIFAQSLTITRAFQAIPNSSVLAQYKNQFGKWEKPDLDDTFPYVVIRVGLDGDGREVQAAKKQLNLYLGQMTAVESVYKDNSNELLFLIPVRSRNIQMDCGDGCDRVTLMDGSVPLRSNTVYYGRVHFVPMEEEKIAPKVLTQYPYTLQVEPKDAHVEAIANGVKQEWVLIDGKAQLFLVEGTYHYTISADKYLTKTGELIVSATQTDTTIALVPEYGWMTIASDSIDLAGLSVDISYKGAAYSKALPFERMQSDTGSYVLKVNKPKYHGWMDTIVVQAGEETIVIPELLPKSYKHNTYLLAEAGLAMNPSWGVGLMVGQVYGEVTKGCGIGWYVQGRSNFQFTKAEEGLMIDQSGAIENEKPYYTGEQRTNEFLLNAGLVLNFLNKQKPNRSKNSMFGLYAGLGYGQYARSWEIEDGRWFEYAPSKAKGLSFGGGLIGSIKGFTINAGINTIQARYVEIEAGLGWTF